MGTFSVRLEMGDPLGHRFEAIDGMVASGGTYTVLPAVARPDQAVQRPIA